MKFSTAILACVAAAITVAQANKPLLPRFLAPADKSAVVMPGDSNNKAIEVKFTQLLTDDIKKLPAEMELKISRRRFRFFWTQIETKHIPRSEWLKAPSTADESSSTAQSDREEQKDSSKEGSKAQNAETKSFSMKILLNGVTLGASDIFKVELFGKTGLFGGMKLMASSEFSILETGPTNFKVPKEFSVVKSVSFSSGEQSSAAKTSVDDNSGDDNDSDGSDSNENSDVAPANGAPKMTVQLTRPLPNRGIRYVVYNAANRKELADGVLTTRNDQDTTATVSLPKAVTGNGVYYVDFQVKHWIRRWLSQTFYRAEISFKPAAVQQEAEETTSKQSASDNGEPEGDGNADGNIAEGGDAADVGEGGDAADGDKMLNERDPYAILGIEHSKSGAESNGAPSAHNSRHAELAKDDDERYRYDKEDWYENDWHVNRI